MKKSEKQAIISEIRVIAPEIANRLSAEYQSGNQLDEIFTCCRIVIKRGLKPAYYDTASKRCFHIRTRHIGGYSGDTRPERNTLCEVSFPV